MHALEHGRPDRAVTFDVLRAPAQVLRHRPVLLTVLAAAGALTGLGIAALLARDPREAGAYAVACLMIGGAMAVGQRARLEADATARRDARAAAGDEVRAVAHDLRAPLITVSSYLELIADGAFGPVSDEARAALRQCAAVTGRAQEVVETTLRPASDVTQVAAPVDLGRVFSDVFDALASTMRERHAEVAVAGRLPAVRGDETALFRVFENLLQNSVKYARPGIVPRIGVASRRVAGGAVEVTVTDNGLGIRPEERAGILGVGVRGAGTQATDGLGLGLATAARLVARMGGTLSIEGRATERGTVVRVTLPGC